MAGLEVVQREDSVEFVLLWTSDRELSGDDGLRVGHWLLVTSLRDPVQSGERLTEDDVIPPVFCLTLSAAVDGLTDGAPSPGHLPTDTARSGSHQNILLLKQRLS